MTEELQQARLRIFQLLGWEQPPERIEEALTHRSYANERRRKRGRAGGRQQPEDRVVPPDNQRLEFLGDAVLGLCVSEILVERFPSADEGRLSRMRAALVKTDSLADFAREINIGPALRLGKGADAAGDRSQNNVLADAVEALVAAAYLDGGLDRARALVSRLMGDRLYNENKLNHLDSKSELQERVQAEGLAAPAYRVVDSGGPDHDRWFKVEVILNELSLANGVGRSKKLAEQEAARSALDQWEQTANILKKIHIASQPTMPPNADEPSPSKLPTKIALTLRSSWPLS
jgi:ribonuclease III